jgi:hypothetical protein
MPPTGDVEIGVDAIAIRAGPCKNDSLAVFGATKSSASSQRRSIHSTGEARFLKYEECPLEVAARREDVIIRLANR